MNFVAGDRSGAAGLDALARLQELDASLAVVLMTAYGGVSLAVEALKRGATRLRAQALAQRQARRHGARGCRGHASPARGGDAEPGYAGARGHRARAAAAWRQHLPGRGGAGPEPSGALSPDVQAWPLARCRGISSSRCWRGRCCWQCCIVIVMRLLAATQFYATALVVVLCAALVVADLVRVVGNADRSTQRFLDSLSAGALEAPVAGTVHSRPAASGIRSCAATLQPDRRTQRQGSDYLQTLLDTVPAALIVVNCDGALRMVNRAAHRLLGEPASRLEQLPALGRNHGGRWGTAAGCAADRAARKRPSTARLGLAVHRSGAGGAATDLPAASRGRPGRGGTQGLGRHGAGAGPRDDEFPYADRLAVGKPRRVATHRRPHRGGGRRAGDHPAPQSRV